MGQRWGKAKTILAIGSFCFGAWAIAPSAVAFAQDSTLKLDSVSPVAPAVPAAEPDTATMRLPTPEATLKPEDDLDKEITDPRLRAQSGSKNKYSSSFSINYSGANLNEPGGAVRPTLGANRQVLPVSLSGNVGLRYRLDKNDSIFFSTGINRPQPLQQSEVSQPTQVSTPSIAWNRTFAYKDKQIASDVRADFTTTREKRQIGNMGAVGYSLTVINPIGYSRYDAGLSLRVAETFFNESAQYSDPAMQVKQNESSISLNPSIQYRISDNLNAFTSFDVFNFSHYRIHSATLDYENTDPTETLGIGYALDRDCYLSPYITFEPLNLSPALATYSLSARINL